MGERRWWCLETSHINFQSIVLNSSIRITFWPSSRIFFPILHLSRRNLGCLKLLWMFSLSIIVLTALNKYIGFDQTHKLPWVPKLIILLHWYFQKLRCNLFSVTMFSGLREKICILLENMCQLFIERFIFVPAITNQTLDFTAYIIYCEPFSSPTFTRNFFANLGSYISWSNFRISHHSESVRFTAT